MVSDTGPSKDTRFRPRQTSRRRTRRSKCTDSTKHRSLRLGIPYGTATYAAPEQAKGERADHRSDIFSTGVLIYEMLTGIWAFQGKTVIDVRHQVLYGTPKPLADMRKEPLPPQLQQIVDKALAKGAEGSLPEDRYYAGRASGGAAASSRCTVDADRYVRTGPRRRQRRQTCAQLVHRQINS